MRRNSKSGSILMECVLVIPLMLLLISIVLQFAHIWMARQITAYAAYCATRAILAVNKDEQNEAAKRAAQMVCSWMALVGRPSNLQGAQNATQSPLRGEILIPGWGAIPGSDSVDLRVKTKVVSNEKLPFAEVTVNFSFPLVLPLAGRMISLFANNPNVNRAQDGSYGDPLQKRGSRWYGDEVGDETVMDENGNAENRKGFRWGAEGKFPFIVLTETCVLPKPYSTEKFPKRGYARRGDNAAVADLPRAGGGW